MERASRSDYEYFLAFHPAAMSGYSIYIYHFALREANRVRQDMGVPPSPNDDAQEP